MAQKPLFSPETSAIADQPPVRADDAVARDDDGDGIAMVGLPDGPGRSGPSNRGGHLTVRSGPPAGDFEKTPPDPLLKIRSLQIEFQPKGPPPAKKILIDLRNGVS
jgi:hypothetical protein